MREPVEDVRECLEAFVAYYQSKGQAPPPIITQALTALGEMSAGERVLEEGRAKALDLLELARSQLLAVGRAFAGAPVGGAISIVDENLRLAIASLARAKA